MAKSDADWMAKYFFAGGTMPSADLFVHFARGRTRPSRLSITGGTRACTTRLDGAEGWLQNMDANAAEVRHIKG